MHCHNIAHGLVGQSLSRRRVYCESINHSN